MMKMIDNYKAGHPHTLLMYFPKWAQTETSFRDLETISHEYVRWEYIIRFTLFQHYLRSDFDLSLSRFVKIWFELIIFHSNFSLFINFLF